MSADQFLQYIIRLFMSDLDADYSIHDKKNELTIFLKTMSIDGVAFLEFPF